ncbi:hypothetical protein GGX14DRAFT_414207 [Mycena pura]|uniref:Bromo domain-containing protein n=1 Tax=Mycena pura TaxID=153505 RepID=A0AAD7E4R7_9AGAR|nr:hypothetical protein GGX14DRAFT_414207 [Mycena pura]
MTITSAQKKAIEEVLDALTSATGSPRKRQLATMFLELVDRREWPEYYEVIPEPRCLDGIRTTLEKNKYKAALDAYTDISLVFLNALFYNEPDSQIAIDAQTLKGILESEWNAKMLPTPPLSPPPQSAQKVHAEPAPTEAHKPQPASITSPQPAVSTTLPTLTVPEPSTSTFVHSNPIPIFPAAVSPIDPPVPLNLYPASESEDETDDRAAYAYEPPPGAPTDAQIVRQLERGLLPYVPVAGKDGGWMANVKHERHLEIVQAIKAYRDVAGVKLSSALEPGVPDDKMAITFKLLESRSRSKTFYTSSQPFDTDIARLFESGRRYYLERGRGIAGVGGDEWARVVALQRVANAFTSTNAPMLPLAAPLVFAPPLPAPGAHMLDSIAYKGFILRAGHYVHVIAGAEAGSEIQLGLGKGRPLIGRVVACWQDEAGEGGISVRWYLHADEISHLIPATRKMGVIEGEVVQTDKTTHHLLPDIIERVACQHVSSAMRGRPRAPAWYPGWPLYVCGYRYDAALSRVRRIKRPDWFSAGGGGAADGDALDLFERPVRIGSGQTKKQSGTIDRSVVTAGGQAVSAMEKLPPETRRHFERDAMTGEVLWFPGPPMHASRAPPPRHRLEYLHFLAKAYNPEVAEPQSPCDVAEEVLVNGNGNGNGTVHGADTTMGGENAQAREGADVEMEPPPAKRQKVTAAAERYISASEVLKEVFSVVAVT